MPNNTPDALPEAETTSGVVQGMPETKTPFEVTVPGKPHSLAWVGSRMTHEVWCHRVVERIAKIPGRSPRIALHKRKGKPTGMILVVDDEFSLPEHSSHSDAVVIQRFIETRSQYKKPTS